VKYEIARAIIDGRGLVAVHINNIRHHQTLAAHPVGLNPLAFMAVGKVQENLFLPPRYYLFEKMAVPAIGGGYKWSWERYADHTDPVDLPSWLAEPAPGYVTPLSSPLWEHDYVLQGGHKNIGGWIDAAAARAGR
jgi:hypothetical protein